MTLNGSAHHSYMFILSLFLFNVHSSLLSLPFLSKTSYIERDDQAASTLLGICSEHPRPYQRDVCSPMFAAALVTVAKNWNQPSCLPTDEEIIKIGLILYIYTYKYVVVHMDYICIYTHIYEYYSALKIK